MNFLQALDNKNVFAEERITITQKIVVMAQVRLSWEHFVATNQQMMYFRKHAQKQENHEQSPINDNRP